MTEIPLEYDVLVVGGGAGGSAAAWQAARMGARVLVAEPTPWLGGMISAAGVCAFDGNKGALATGFFRRLRDAIDEHYGGAAAVKTGWVSDTSFEPHVAANLFAQFLAEAGADVWHGAELAAVLREGNRIEGARFSYQGALREVRARVTIEATEYGDVLAMGGVPHRLGRESAEETGESAAPARPDTAVQDMTWVAILKKYGADAPQVARPAGYDPAIFDCSTAEICSTPDPELLNHPLHDWESFLTYGLLPNEKFMLNWPFRSNDSPDSFGIFGSAADRAEAHRLAKQRTLSYVYYIQNELGHPEWGLAADEFDTDDGLPYIPYIREARRIKGVALMAQDDVVPAPRAARAPFRLDAIAIGDYFLDHHHSQAHRPPAERLVENLPDNAPFQVPYGCLVPEEIDGLIAAEKSISVTHIINGCTRLQPIVMLIGQAAGAAAATAAAARIEPREIDVSKLQRFLIDEERVALYPYNDLDHRTPYFSAVQRLSMAGLRDRIGSLSFSPNHTHEPSEIEAIAAIWQEEMGLSGHEALAAACEGMTRGEYFQALARLLP